jgi:hypothetical protein
VMRARARSLSMMRFDSPYRNGGLFHHSQKDFFWEALRYYLSMYKGALIGSCQEQDGHILRGCNMLASWNFSPACPLSRQVLLGLIRKAFNPDENYFTGGNLQIEVNGLKGCHFKYWIIFNPVWKSIIMISSVFNWREQLRLETLTSLDLLFFWELFWNQHHQETLFFKGVIY